MSTILQLKILKYSLLHLPQEWRPFSANCRHSRKCQHPFEGVHCYCEGPQRNPEKRLQSHQCRTQSPWKEIEEALSWQVIGNSKELATVHTVCRHAQNMVKGVTLGFHHKMRSGNAHFPTNTVIQENSSLVEIWNFLGEKYNPRVWMRPGVACSVTQERGVNSYRKWHWTGISLSCCDSVNHHS